ncbi:hypothetical protein ABTY59_09950 [Streptomyces sp. NPDC096079]|uniref:hypothetical protein n=1 Tax=unclassified Streptomyces TaxID=2593676 RepID=UPI0033170372
MRVLLWLLLAASVLGNVYVSTFAGWSGTLQLVGSLCSGTLLLGSAVGLWLTRPHSEG